MNGRRQVRARPGHPGHAARGSVRIIAGAWRGRRVAVPAGPKQESPGQSVVRPTPDRVRETLFNWLMPVLPGMHCLDLYAGTGILGLEALSRGAAEAVFVDADPRAVAALQATLRDFGTSARVLCLDAVRFLRSGDVRPFDLVFLDPPYAEADLGNLCTLLAQGWLSAGALIYLETSRANPFPVLPDGWEMHRESTAAEVRFGLVRCPRREPAAV